MVALQPEKGVGDQEIAHFIAPVVKNERAPVGVLALAGVCMFVEIGAVELGQAVCILRKMAGHPIDDDADAALVALVYEMTKLVRIAEPAGRGVVTGDLVAP